MTKTILIVDDDVDFSKELAERLSAEGYMLKVINNSLTAADHLIKNNYDLILLDYKMPGLNGIDLLKLIKKFTPSTKVFIISGRPFIENILETEAGSIVVDGIINKPFNDKILLEAINKAFN